MSNTQENGSLDYRMNDLLNQFIPAALPVHHSNHPPIHQFKAVL